MNAANVVNRVPRYITNPTSVCLLINFHTAFQIVCVEAPKQLGLVLPILDSQYGSCAFHSYFFKEYQTKTLSLFHIVRCSTSQQRFRSLAGVYASLFDWPATVGPNSVSCTVKYTRHVFPDDIRLREANIPRFPFWLGSRASNGVV